MQIIVDVKQGKAIIGSKEVPVEEIADKKGLQIDGRDGPILRSITFGERLGSILRAISASQPKDFLAAGILHRATIQPGIGDNRILEILALKLAGADLEALPLNEEAQSVARATGWTLEYINDKAAIEIDHIAGQIIEKTSRAGWKQLFLVAEARDELEMIRNYLVNNLLRRADVNNATEPLEDEIVEHDPPPHSPKTARPDIDPKLSPDHVRQDISSQQKNGRDKPGPFIPPNPADTIRNDPEAGIKIQPVNSKGWRDGLPPQIHSPRLTGADSDGDKHNNRKPTSNHAVHPPLTEEKTVERQLNEVHSSENLSTIRETFRFLNSNPWKTRGEAPLSPGREWRTEQPKMEKHSQNKKDLLSNPAWHPDEAGIAGFSPSIIRTSNLSDIADALAVILDEEADMRGIDR